MSSLKVETEHGVYTIDLEREEVEGLEEDGRLDAPAPISTGLPRVVAAAASGSTVIAVVKTRPPLAVSHDAGRTWHQAGGGLPAGRALAIADEDPDLIVYAARNRLYLSRDGGRFWHALAPELPEITGIELWP
jgi:hypothetical protein